MILQFYIMLHYSTYIVHNYASLCCAPFYFIFECVENKRFIIILSVGRFVPWDVLSEGLFVLLRFVFGRFVLGRFICASRQYANFIPLS